MFKNRIYCPLGNFSIGFTVISFLSFSNILNANTINIPNDYANIQEGIDASSNADTVLVHPGTYVENINFNGKNIVVGSLFLTTQDTSYISSTIIDGNQDNSVVIFSNGETSAAVLSGFTIQNGSATYGGGIYLSNSSPSLVNLNIRENETVSWRYGGGIYCYNSSPRINNVILSGNSAVTGGGIFLDHLSNPTLENVAISGNTATYAGGIWCEYLSNPILYNATITENTNGGIILSNSASCVVMNTIFWNNSPNIEFREIYASNTITVSFSDIQGGQESIVTNSNGTVNWLSGNIDYYPEFVDSANGNYHLADTSPCIGAGIDSIEIDGTWYYAPTTDLDGNPRPNPSGSNPDIGAYENSRATPTIDIIPPAPPQNLTATPGNQQITLRWNQNTESDLHKYNIYRDTSSPATTLIDSCVASSPPDTFYTDTGLINGQTYYYRITAVDSAGNESGYSDEASGIPNPLMLIVKKDETGDFTSIQAAIDTSIHGDTILVHPGTYVENINFNGKNIVVGSLFLTTKDTSYISQTIIDGNQNGNVVKFENGENNNAKLSGFTIQNGYGFQGYYYEQSGGGINCRNSSPQLKKLVIKNNSSVKYGGGIYCDDSSPHISDVKIISNTSSSCGGGICITGTLNNSSSEPIISNIEIINNTAGNDGGGMSVFHGSNPATSNVVISGNTGTHGGGIQLQDSDITLKNVLITNNIANHPTSPYGGGIYCNGSSPTLINCTISGNEASNGGAVHCYAASNPIIINSMLWDNVPQEIYFQWESGTGQSAMTINITHSNINGGLSNIQTDGIHTVIWNDGNIDTDPLFIDTTIGNYRLTDYSPCIGAGLDTSIVPITDLDGNPRPNPAGSNPDIGAYENPRATPIDTIPPAIPQNLVITDYLQTISLKWNASVNADLSHYNIYRASSPDFSADSIYFKGKAFAPDTTYIDSLIQNNNTYYYQVTAVDTTGNESDPSDELVITAIVVDIWDITFQQRVDGSGLVNIYYSFSGHDTTHYEIIPYLSNFNDEAWGKLTQVSGDAGAVLPGDSRQITWNLKSEAPEIYSNNSTIKITIGFPSKGNQYNPLNEAKIQIEGTIKR